MDDVLGTDRLQRVMGLRISEAFGVLVDDVIDLGDSGVLLVRGQGGRPFRVGDDEGRVVAVTHKERTKTEAGSRALVLPSALLEMLRIVVEAFHTNPETGDVDETARLVPGLRTADHSGQLSFREAFETAATAEGLGSNDLGFRVSPHLLRKSVATDLAWQKGIEGAVRRRFLGHRASDDVFGRVYTLDHPELTPLAEVARVLDELVRGSIGCLLVPTTRRIRWGHAHQNLSRAVHAEATLSATRRDRPSPPPPPVVTATIEATLAIDRIGLPPALVASLKHLASVHNPEFHQREQLRLSTWNTPRMIRCYEEDLDRLYLPRGLLDEAAKVVGVAGSRLEVEDRRPVTPTKPLTFTGELSSAQKDAVAELARHDLGVLIAPTGAGKTVVACALIARLATPTLVLVHTKPLAEQWRQRLGDLLGLQRREIGQLGAGRTRRSGIVDLVTLQTLARREDAADVFDGYGLVVVDECHHLPAVTFERCVRSATNRRWVGLTATPRRRDGLEGIFHMQLGPVRHTMGEDAAATVLIRRDLIVHETLTDPDAPEDAAVQAILGRVAGDEDRTRQICVDVADAHRRGRNILVFTDRTVHLEALRAELSSRHGLEPPC